MSNDATNVAVFSPDNDDPLSFTIGNPATAPRPTRSSRTRRSSVDDYDPTNTRIYLDDGDGIFEIGQDTLHSPGVNDPVLAPDDAGRFVVERHAGEPRHGRHRIVQLDRHRGDRQGRAGTTFRARARRRRCRRGRHHGHRELAGHLRRRADARDAREEPDRAVVLRQPPFPGAVITYTLTLTSWAPARSRAPRSTT